MKTLRITLLASALFFINIASSQTFNCGTDSMILKEADHKAYFNQFSRIVNEWRQANPGPNYLPTIQFPSFSSGLMAGSSCKPAKFIVPVVVHIVHGTGESIGTGSNISDAQVENAIEALNQYFSNHQNYGAPAVNTGIQFCLAKTKPDSTAFSGITRHADNGLANPRWETDHEDLMNLGYLNESNYVNIWVVNSFLNSNGVGQKAIGGFATFPYFGGKKGIVVRHDVMGNYNTFDSCILANDSRGGVLAHEMGHF
jgi:hypothetical protein